MPQFSWITAACASSLLIISTVAVGGQAQQFTTLVDLGTSDAQPASALVQAAGGKLFGTGTIGHGSIFTITPTGVLTIFHLFGGTEGSGPGTGIIQGTDGNFYGVTGAGGTTSRGTIYKITPSGILTVLYTFCPQPQPPCPDGEFPGGRLVQASDGNFYGTTAQGGHNGEGTVFRITPAGSFTTLYRFNGTDGRSPTAALIQGSDGNLYGTTSSGGSKAAGTIFKMTTNGTLTVLHVFGNADGIGPHAALVQGREGKFYGTTYLGGTNTCGGSGCGTIFTITPNGDFATLHNFAKTDGRDPETPLILASDNNFYGTTVSGGVMDLGTIFEITPTGTLTTLYSFCMQSGCPDGRQPYGLVQYTNGALYGTTLFGGDTSCNGGSGCGTVYSLVLGLRPFVRTLPVAAHAGASVRILGTNLTDTTVVNFNGVPASFRVVSRSNIKTSVPVGSSTGLLQVVTSERTLSSNTPFQVLP